METQKYNKSEIMKDAWRLFRLYRKFSWSFGKCLSIAWDNAKIEIKNNEAKAKAKRLAEEEARRIEYRKHVVLSHVGMDSLYGNRVYSGD
jgi:hypothetical protein